MYMSLRVYALLFRCSLRVYVPPCVRPSVCTFLRVYVPPCSCSLRVHVPSVFMFPPCVCPLHVYVRRYDSSFACTFPPCVCPVRGMSRPCVCPSVCMSPMLSTSPCCWWREKAHVATTQVFWWQRIVRLQGGVCPKGVCPESSREISAEYREKEKSR